MLFCKLYLYKCHYILAVVGVRVPGQVAGSQWKTGDVKPNCRKKKKEKKKKKKNLSCIVEAGRCYMIVSRLRTIDCNDLSQDAGLQRKLAKC